MDDSMRMDENPVAIWDNCIVWKEMHDENKIQIKSKRNSIQFI